MDIQTIKKRYDKIISDQSILLIEKQKIKKKSKRIKEELKNYTDTRDVLNQAIETVSMIFKKEIEETITNSIKQVFDRDLSFNFDYDRSKNGVKTKISIIENGEELEPKDDLGGSIIDIISLSFRIILWQMSHKKSRNVFILDEPFKWVGKLSQLTGIILKELSEKLNFQVIMTTHDDNLIDIADKVFKISNIDGISKITIEKGE